MDIIDYIYLLVISVAIFVVFILYPICFLYKEKHGYLKSLNEIPFKSFVAFYNIAPTKWTLNRSYVTYETIDMQTLDLIEKGLQCGKAPIFKDNIYRTPMKEYEFTFKFLDMIKYKFWHKQLLYNEERKKKYDERQKNYEQYQEALEYLKKDLEDFKKQKPWEDIKYDKNDTL